METEKTTIDRMTGVVLEESKQKIIKTEEPDYVKFYIKAWCAFKNIKSFNNSFFFALLNNASLMYADKGQLLLLNTYIKRQVGKDLNWSEKTVLNRFNQEIKKLTDSQLLSRIELNVYRVNPELIGKGQWKDIKKLRPIFNLETGKVDTNNYAGNIKIVLTDEEMEHE